MFSLIITIISIALVAALALATLYYGGNAFNKGSAEAEASKIAAQAQQVLGAVSLYRAERADAPTAANLLAHDYLATIPTLSGNGVQWTELVAGEGSFWATNAVSKEVCLKFNKMIAKVEGIPTRPLEDVIGSCFGAANATLYSVIINNPKQSVSSILASAQTTGQDVSGGVIAAGMLMPMVSKASVDSADWAQVPSAEDNGSTPPPVADGTTLLSVDGTNPMDFPYELRYRHVIAATPLAASAKGTTYEHTFTYSGPAQWDRSTMIQGAWAMVKSDSGTFTPIPFEFRHISGDTYKAIYTLTDSSIPLRDDGDGGQFLDVRINVQVNSDYDGVCALRAEWETTAKNGSNVLTQDYCS